MNQHDLFKKYLIKVFLCTLFILGITEALINLAFIQFLYPILDQVFMLHQLFDKTSLTGLLVLSAENIFWILTWELLSLMPIKISETLQIYAGKHIENGVFTRFLSSQANFAKQEANLYIFLLVSIILVLVIIWILPFLFASIFFSLIVSKKVREMEENTISEQQKYEQQKSLLLSDIAHDLKTPITTISGYANMLLSDDISIDNSREYLEAIYHKSLQMDNIISILFEYVKLDSAGFSMHLKTENFSEIVRGCIASVYTDFEEKNMQIEIDIPEQDYYAQIDLLHMQRAITNVLTNAIKHNPAGTTVTVKLRQKEKNLILQIIDNGEKIPEDIIHTIFDPFVQGDRSRSGKTGSGLGLSISKKVLTMHHGDLIIHQTNDSAKSYTKIFVFTLPIPEL